MEEVQTANTTKRDVKSILKIVGWIVGVVGFITLVISLISLIVVGAKDYTTGKKYSYEESIMGIKIKAELTLNKDGTFTEFAEMMGEIEEEEGKYRVSDGKLYVDYAWDDDTSYDTGYEEYGKISATKIIIEDSEIEELSATMVCKSAKTQQNVSTAFAVIGGILTVAGAGLVITLYCLGKKKTTDTEEAQV